MLTEQPEPGKVSDCIELPPLGIYKISDSIDQLSLYPWKHFDDYQKLELSKLELLFNSINLLTPIEPKWLLPEPTENNFDFYSLLKGQQFGKDHEEIFNFFLENKNISEAIDDFTKLLKKSVTDRVLTTPQQCEKCFESGSSCNHSKVAILFSGGIDCTILASIAHQCLPETQEIDLLNVAFEKVGTKENINWDVPDRISAQHSHKELKILFPRRQWNLVEVNICRESLENQIQSHIKHLLFPLKTVLDESLGSVFWFASKGESENGSCPARVILIGSGADELFGGYVRHRNAFDRCGGSFEDKLDSVEKELEMDWQRIPSRNLGRDDRVIADNARTARSPFIEENIVKFVRSLKGSQKCCMDKVLPEGVGDKLFLRLTGYKLGLRNVVSYKKRAAQFGSRIADKKQNAKDLSVYLKI